uniref:Agouti domain-containing protein n=1 Tax=Monopterus albus TaxID=43700 RepID=A0A3Q3IZ21_MONAL|nr:agouti-signaling protein-like [Monopterus albus]XP_020442409.1 agouti-signaling protein-like [Monopterus albus]XP_020442410.1 agouti-signaling protein-like [Monopterus albus]XP_020442411.1 agouti-signaling protein-like [Monopterus albus]XP_020442412.1 agouti-signaling protein-like [Monopterus albus]XP_020442413.1 agouti-signaling protein-like [Monopterus albus]
MRKIINKHLCFFVLIFSLSWAEDMKRDVGKTDDDTVWSRVKTRQLFARRKISPPQENHVPKQKSDVITPARRCGRLMENCFSHMLCCDPCASCRCRLFNTICHCWKINPLCSKKT